MPPASSAQCVPVAVINRAGGGDRGGVSNTAHRNRRSAGYFGPVSKLTTVVQAPAVDAAAGKQRTGVLTSGDDSDGGGYTAHRNRRSVGYFGPIPKLTKEVFSPAVDAAAGQQPTRVHLASGEGARS